jgi:hypothetical protein
LFWKFFKMKRRKNHPSTENNCYSNKMEVLPCITRTNAWNLGELI